MRAHSPINVSGLRVVLTTKSEPECSRIFSSKFNGPITSHCNNTEYGQGDPPALESSFTSDHHWAIRLDSCCGQWRAWKEMELEFVDMGYAENQVDPRMTTILWQSDATRSVDTRGGSVLVVFGYCLWLDLLAILSDDGCKLCSQSSHLHILKLIAQIMSNLSMTWYLSDMFWYHLPGSLDPTSIAPEL